MFFCLFFFPLSNIHWWTYIDLEIRVTLPFKSQKKNDWKYNCYIWYYIRVYSLENSYTNYYFIIISYYFNTITANLPLNPFSGLNSVSHWLFIPTLLSGAPSARWVASNQNPTNVKLINEWKYHESYSLLSGMYYLFPPFTHLHISSSTGSLTGSVVSFRYTGRHRQGVIQSSGANKSAAPFIASADLMAMSNLKWQDCLGLYHAIDQV